MGHKTREQRRTEAVERQARYDALTLNQKREIAISGPGLRKREIKRLADNDKKRAAMKRAAREQES